MEVDTPHSLVDVQFIKRRQEMLTFVPHDATRWHGLFSWAVRSVIFFENEMLSLTAQPASFSGGCACFFLACLFHASCHLSLVCTLFARSRT